MESKVGPEIESSSEMNDVQEAEALQFLSFQYKPYVLLHPEETDFPVDVQSYVRQCKLRPKDAKGKKVDPSNHQFLTPRLLSKLCLESNNGLQDQTLYLPRGMDSSIIQTSAASFSQNQPPYYVRIVPEKDFIYIVFFFFYAFNGPARVFGSTWKCMQIRSYEHQADVEYVTMKFSRHKVGDVAYPFVSLFCSVHSGGKNYSKEEVEWIDGTHPKIYSALFSHASHIRPGYHGRFLYTVGDECKETPGGTRTWFPRRLVFFPDNINLQNPEIRGKLRMLETISDVKYEKEDEVEADESDDSDLASMLWMSLYRGDLGDDHVSSFRTKTCWSAPDEEDQHHGEQLCWCTSI